MRKTPKQYRINCKCRKCNKPYSYDKRMGYPFGGLCRECAKSVNK